METVQINPIKVPESLLLELPHPILIKNEYTLTDLLVVLKLYEQLLDTANARFVEIRNIQSITIYKQGE